MNPNELMLGDLVYAGKNVIHVTAATIGLGKYEDLKPIPLTTDILRKNGLDNDGAYFHCQEFGISYWKSNLFQLLISRQRKYDPREQIAINLTYVHELQHALRLWGIEKEVVV